MTNKSNKQNEIEIRDGENSVQKENESVILIGNSFSSINIKLKTRSGEVRQYLLRRTKNDKLVLV